MTGPLRGLRSTFQLNQVVIECFSEIPIAVEGSTCGPVFAADDESIEIGEHHQTHLEDMLCRGSRRRFGSDLLNASLLFFCDCRAPSAATRCLYADAIILADVQCALSG
jgi:hypothetical protein